MYVRSCSIEFVDDILILYMITLTSMLVLVDTIYNHKFQLHRLNFQDYISCWT